MKKLLLAALLSTVSAPAFAVICPSVPNTFINGQVADANQVNANFVALLSCFNTSVAKNGANADISQLNGLAFPPIGVGSLYFYGIAVGGTGSAINIPASYPVGIPFSIPGTTLVFNAIADNAGATTINGVAIRKPTSAGPAALVAGDIRNGQTVVVESDAVHWNLVSPVAPPVTLAAPQFTLLAPGSGTYTTPVGAVSLEVEACGAGSGGGAAGTGGTAGGAGGNTTFGVAFLTASGGPVTPATGNLAFSTPATATGGDVNIPGGLGSYGWLVQATGVGQNYSVGGTGASSFLGAGAPGGATVSATPIVPPASAALCAGGGGGASQATTVTAGFGGNSGGYVRKLITSPAATYAYVVGAAGAAGVAGTSGQNGSIGGAGAILVTAR